MRSTLFTVVHIILAASTLVNTNDALLGTNNAKRIAMKKFGYKTVGCHLEIPKSVEEHFHPNINHGNPLLLSVKIRVSNVRDVPDSGGSFGVDVK